MKTYFLPLTMGFLLILSGCTETIFVEVPGKTDTLKVEKFIDRVFSNTDTIEVPIEIMVPVPTRTQDTVIHDLDTVYITRVDTIYITQTVYVPRVDSIFVTRVVYLTDTVMIRERFYADTLMITVGRAIQQVPEPLRKMVEQFYIDAAAHGLNPPGYPILIEYAPIDPVLQAYSYTAFYQRFLKLNQSLTNDESYLPLMRELSRLYLGKVYSSDPNSVMHPFYPSDKIRWSNRAQYKTELNEFFK